MTDSVEIALIGLVAASIPSFTSILIFWRSQKLNQVRQAETNQKLNVAADQADKAAQQASKAAVVAVETHKLVNGEKTERLRQVADLSARLAVSEPTTVTREASKLATAALQNHLKELERGGPVVDAELLLAPNVPRVAK
jgi:hypothetical protein